MTKVKYNILWELGEMWQAAKCFFIYQASHQHYKARLYDYYLNIHEQNSSHTRLLWLAWESKGKQEVNNVCVYIKSVQGEGVATQYTLR